MILRHKIAEALYFSRYGDDEDTDETIMRYCMEEAADIVAVVVKHLGLN